MNELSRGLPVTCFTSREIRFAPFTGSNAQFADFLSQDLCGAVKLAIQEREICNQMAVLERLFPW